MELEHQSRARGVRFHEESEVQETSNLLSATAGSSTSRGGAEPLVFGSVTPSGPSLQPPAQAMQRPSDLDSVPAAFNLWPARPLKIACPNCGAYVETALDNETECMGFFSLFSDGPLFRNISSHYCPNCQGYVGVHYTGETCGRGMGCCHVE